MRYEAAGRNHGFVPKALNGQTSFWRNLPVRGRLKQALGAQPSNSFSFSRSIWDGALVIPESKVFGENLKGQY